MDEKEARAYLKRAGYEEKDITDEILAWCMANPPHWILFDD